VPKGGRHRSADPGRDPRRVAEHDLLHRQHDLAGGDGFAPLDRDALASVGIHRRLQDAAQDLRLDDLLRRLAVGHGGRGGRVLARLGVEEALEDAVGRAEDDLPVGDERAACGHEKQDDSFQSLIL